MRCPYCKEEIERFSNTCSVCGEHIPIIYRIFDFRLSKKHVQITSLLVVLLLLVYFIGYPVYQFNKALTNKAFNGHIILVEESSGKPFRQTAKDIQDKLSNIFGHSVYIAKYYRNRAVIYTPKQLPIKVITSYLKEDLSNPSLVFRKKVNGQWVDTGLTGNQIKKASVTTSNSSIFADTIAIKFNKEGEEKFAKLTKELIGQELGIFYEGELLSAPVIREQILGGEAQISSGEERMTIDKAKEICEKLQSGVDLKIIEVKE